MSTLSICRNSSKTQNNHTTTIILIMKKHHIPTKPARFEAVLNYLLAVAIGATLAAIIFLSF